MHNIKQGLSQKYFMGTATFEELKKSMIDLFYAVKMDQDQLNVVVQTSKNYLSKVDIAKHEFPDNSKEIDKFAKWLRTDYLKMINTAAKPYGMKFML